MWHHESIVDEYSFQNTEPSVRTSWYVLPVAVYTCNITALTNDLISSKMYCLALYLSVTAFCRPYSSDKLFDSSVSKYSIQDMSSCLLKD